MIEKSQKSSNIGETLDYLEKGKTSNQKESTLEYLDRSDDNQIRNLYSFNGNKISAEKGKEIAGYFKSADVRIYNPETDQVSIEELHKMAKDIINARSEQAGKKLGAVYAIHYRPDGSNKHIHIAFFGDDRSLQKSGKGKEWINKLDEIELKYTKDEKEREKVIERNKKRIDTLTSKPTGTQKIDNFIWRHLNKKTGHFSYQQFSINIQKSKMNDKAKEYYLKRVSQRLRGLEKRGIAKSIDGVNWQVDLEKYRLERERIAEKAKNYMRFEQTIKLDRQEKQAKLNELRIQKGLLFRQNSQNFQKMKNQLTLHKSNISLQISQNNETIEQIKIEETEIKLELLENKLLQYGQINPSLALIKAQSDDRFSKEAINAIRKSVELQISHLESLVNKGVVKREGDTYKLAVSKEEFFLYKNSIEASKLRNKKATQYIRRGSIGKKIENKVDRIVNRNTKISVDGFLRDTKRAYYIMKSLDRRSVAWNMVSFATAITWAVGKTVTKATLKVAYKMTKASVKSIAWTAKEFGHAYKQQNMKKKQKHQKKIKQIKQEREKIMNKSREKGSLNKNKEVVNERRR